jgi:hypothetical protein
MTAICSGCLSSLRKVIIRAIALDMVSFGLSAMLLNSLIQQGPFGVQPFHELPEAVNGIMVKSFR